MEKDRKLDHINLSLQSQTPGSSADQRFWYEPILSAHPSTQNLEVGFLKKTMKAPLWISSMTGGTQMARTINHNLSMACKEFGLGMGLGSCRKILEDNTHFEDFNLRPIMGDDLPLFANLGIAQVEYLLKDQKFHLADQLIDKLNADGLIVHINPMQEWMQPEGDLVTEDPLTTIKKVLDHVKYPIIVKEVGQGFGPESLRQLLKLPLAAIDFGAYGGTNFSLVELFRRDEPEKQKYEPMVRIGHTADDMLNIINNLVSSGATIECKQLIISGGIQTYLDGYYLIAKSQLPAIYAQASAFLKHSQGEYEPLRKFVAGQIEGYKMAHAFLKVRK
ncbi:isopentenyl-diphosphate delta-isomerase [Bacteroidales bacterium 6E]|nr:isopentenyl-diphosphate delta-isomerase [Bacteroidales bacterium 6E]